MTNVPTISDVGDQCHSIAFFYCGSFDIYHSGLAQSVLFFVTVYLVKISTVPNTISDLFSKYLGLNIFLFVVIKTDAERMRVNTIVFRYCK